MNKLKLNDIISVKFQTEIQDSFSEATGFGVVFTNESGKHIGHTNNFCEFCKEINKTKEGQFYCSCTNKKAIDIAINNGKPSKYICHAGLVNIEIPLMYNNQCIGAITAGNVICKEENDYIKDPMLNNIKWLDDERLKKLYNKISVVSKKRVDATTKTLSNITNYILQNAFYLQAQKEISRQKEEILEEKLKRMELENALKYAKMDALQKQVTPHFIFNVINSISRLLDLEEYEIAKKTVNSFAQMMRYNLNDVKNMVTMDQELKYIENYLCIQKIRFNNRINYKIHCENGLKNFMIPFFSLQPLVENAVEHGILKKEEGGLIIISINSKKVLKDNVVEIKITDNGIGMDTEKLNSIINNMKKDNNNKEHIGIYNCIQRFKLIFEDDFIYNISSNYNIGTYINFYIKKDQMD